MSMKGMGVMIHSLWGSSRESDEFVGKTITSAKIEDNKLRLEFSDGTKIAIFDDGQSCCESRYMVCDDELAVLVGATFLEAKIESAPDAPKGEDEWRDHEIEFLHVNGSQGGIVISNHNEHNGYYGGFEMKIEVEEAVPEPQAGPMNFDDIPR